LKRTWELDADKAEPLIRNLAWCFEEKNRIYLVFSYEVSMKSVIWQVCRNVKRRRDATLTRSGTPHNLDTATSPRF
jgi:hypothetical protein